MSLINSKNDKARLRQKCISIRKDMTSQEKSQKDTDIAEKLFKLWQYKRAAVVLCYVSMTLEVDTVSIIGQALKDGKRVAVPYCVPGTREMEFYFISSVGSLQKGAFGVLEPVPNCYNKVTDFAQSLCLVPAMCYDYEGYRVGYGKGYYDRFLIKYHGYKIGLCYRNCMTNKIHTNRFDQKVDVVVTDEKLYKLQ